MVAFNKWRIRTGSRVSVAITDEANDESSGVDSGSSSINTIAVASSIVARVCPIHAVIVGLLKQAMP